MATRTATVGMNWYDPDDVTYAPLTIEMPDTDELPHGTELWLVNKNQSSVNNVTLQANALSSLDEIEDPTDGTVAYATSVVVSGANAAGSRMHYVLNDMDYAAPTWICLEYKAP